MIFEKQPSMIQFKTASGDEVIAKVLDYSEESEVYVIKDALVVERIMFQGQVGVTLRSWTMNQFDVGKDELQSVITVSPEQIMAVTIPNHKMLHQYNSTIAYYTNPDDFGQEIYDLMGAVEEDEDSEFDSDIKVKKTYLH
jgi:effector-binding domain-containing protein